MIGSDPMERLSAAYKMEVDAAEKERHVEAVRSAIRTAPPVSAPSRSALRRRVAALAGALVIAAPVGVAVAAESTVPWDALYPVKELTERVRSVFDPEIEARHRVDEAERLFFRRAPRRQILRAVERAEFATTQLDDPGTLGPRLDVIREHIKEQERHAPVEDHEGSGSVPGSPGDGTHDGGSPGSSKGPGDGDTTGEKDPGHTTTTHGSHSDADRHEESKSSGRDGSTGSEGGDAMGSQASGSDSTGTQVLVVGHATGTGTEKSGDTDPRHP